MKPIVHLSFPVNDLDEAIRFYTETFGAQLGRRTDAYANVFLFGAQVTLQNDRENVLRPMPRSCHFGATLDWAAWESIAERLKASVCVVEGPAASYVGEPIEQTKLMVADPSGNLIELKAYRHPENVLGSLVDVD
jgi:extradiol dioxygenase family protein